MRIAALVAAVCALLSGCAPAASSLAHRLRIAIPYDPTSLSPIVAFNQDAIALDLLWCQTLVGLDEYNRFVPVLVTRIPSRENGDISPDGLRITYHLRPEVRFADGVPLTSADVAFTYRAILAPANSAASTQTYARIASLQTPDAHTVTITLRSPWSAAVHNLFAEADFAYGILPKHAFTGTTVPGSAWEQHAFGTGPFRVVAWHRGERIELEPNPYFIPRPKLTHITVRFTPNLQTAFNALQTHAVDTAELDVDDIGRAKSIDGLRVTSLPENGLRALYLQTVAAPTIDLHVRRAIAYAIDRAQLAKAWRNAYPSASSVFPAPVVSWNAPALPPYQHDLARAGRELDAAGYRLLNGKRMRDGAALSLVGVVQTSDAVGPRIAVIVQEQLRAIGAEVTVKSYPATLFSSFSGPLRSGRFSFSPASLIGGSDPEASLNLTCDEAHNGGANYGRFCSQALDTLFAAQQRAKTAAQRDRDFDAIATLVHDQVPLIPLYDLTYIEGVNERVTTYRRNMLRFPVRAQEWDAL